MNESEEAYVDKFWLERNEKLRKEKFLKNVIKIKDKGKTKCWIWKGAGASYDAPIFCFKGVKQAAARVGYEIFYSREFPKNEQIRKNWNCGPLCVNPAHFQVNKLGTKYQPRMTKTKVVCNFIPEILYKYSRGNYSRHRLSNEFGISWYQVNKIIRGNAGLESSKSLSKL